MTRWVAYVQTEDAVIELARYEGEALEALELARAVAPRGHGVAVGLVREGRDLPISPRERREKQNAAHRRRIGHKAVVEGALRSKA